MSLGRKRRREVGCEIQLRQELDGMAVVPKDRSAHERHTDGPCQTAPELSHAGP